MTWVNTGGAISGGGVTNSPYASEAEVQALKTDGLAGGAIQITATGTSTTKSAGDWAKSGPLDASATSVTASGTSITKTAGDWAKSGPLDASATSVTASGSTTARSLADIAASAMHAGDTVINVKGPPYNAKGDGVTDDTAAIQAAIARAVGGGTVFIPPGKYRLTGSLLLHSGVIIQGATSVNFVFQAPTGNEKPSYLFSDSPGVPIFYNDATKSLYDVVIRDLQLGSKLAVDTTPDATGKKGINLVGSNATGEARNILIERVVFSGLQYGLFVADTNPGVGLGWNISPAAVKNCAFYYNQTGVFFNTENADAWRFDTCEFAMAAANATGITITRGGYMSISNCYFVGVNLGGGLAAGMVGIRYNGVERDNTVLTGCHSEQLLAFVSVESGAADTTLRQLVLVGCAIESDIYFSRATHYVSIANRYGGSTGGGKVYALSNGVVVDSIFDTFSVLAPSGFDWTTTTSGFNTALWTPAGETNGINYPSTFLNGYHFKGGVSADRGDTSTTLTAGVDEQTQIWGSALTANRTVTLSTIGAKRGDTFRVVRTGLGAFTIDVGPGLKTIPSATAAFVDVAYNGTAWVLTGYGTL